MDRRTRRARAHLTLVGLLTALALLVPAGKALAGDLQPGVPTAITGGFFDDHSIGGDNHRGWGPTEEPLEVRFHSTVTTAGADIGLCGTPSAPGFMAATLGACGSGGAQVGWFRYAIANHFGWNQWQLLDFQRFALVRVGGPEVIWDTRWGTCVNNSLTYTDCSHNPAEPSLTNMGFVAGTKTMQDGAPSDEVIAIPNELGYRLPEGAWQLVHIVNPYGAIPEDGAGLANNVTCARLTLTWDPAPGPSADPLEVTPRAGTEPCQVPAAFPPRITGPGDPADPLRFAVASAPCAAPTAAGHCWTTPPTGCSPATPTARTFISGSLVPAVDPCAPGAGSAPVAAGGVSPVTGLSRRAASLRMSRTLAKRYAARAIGKVLGVRRTPRHVHATCRVTSRVGARCVVTYRSGRTSVRGRIWLRFVAGSRANRWEYRADVRRTRRGRTVHVKRTYRSGGTVGSSSARS